MIAYNKIWLKNVFIRQEAENAFEQEWIMQEEYKNIRVAYPDPFYTPNFFIRIGLIILTIIILCFSFGLLALMFLSSIEHTAAGLAIFSGIVTSFCLEYFIKIKRHYRSGVDDSMLWWAAIMLFCGISLPNDLSNLGNCQIIFIISLLATIRYADSRMAAVCFIAALGMIFFLGISIGGIMKAMLPFIIMLVSFCSYVFVKKINAGKTFNVYSSCFTIIEILSLVMLYVAGNYLVVRELSNDMFDLNLKPGQSIPFGFVFWIFTIIIPFVYLFNGIWRKNLVLLRTALLLIAATVFTFRYYHAILLPEVLMVIAGLLLILLMWAIKRYLHVPKYGFTAEEINTANLFGSMQVESLILAETFSQQQGNEGTKFGGGSFGGGGASGDY